MTPTSPSSHILQPTYLQGDEKYQFLFRVSLMKDREKVVMLLNFDLRVQDLLIFKVTKWAICLKHFWYKLKDNGCLKEKYLCDYWTWAKLSTCFMEYHFYVKEWLTMILWLFRSVYRADIFLKMSQVSLSFKEKQSLMFVISGKMWTFKKQ